MVDFYNSRLNIHLVVKLIGGLRSVVSYLGKGPGAPGCKYFKENINPSQTYIVTFFLIPLSLSPLLPSPSFFFFAVILCVAYFC